MLTVPWTIIGGQMVLLHALEHGHSPLQISQDGDVVADVRAEPSAIRKIVTTLRRAGFELEGGTPDGVGHRYTRNARGSAGVIAIDVLAPEGLRGQNRLVTSPPWRTVEVPGGTQALGRSAPVTVTHQGRAGTVPRPTLLAAIVLKAAASGLPHNPARHLVDLTLLCALLEDPFAARDSLAGKDRRRLAAVTALRDEEHPAWRLLPAPIRPRGHTAYTLLSR